MVFESAVYTDVTSDESVDRLDGFQFQAVSEGITGADRDVIVADMLHQKSREWPFDRDEREHPPTVAYLRTETGFYFSRGMSTGKTHSGRDGNQLTQIVVAREAADIDPYRPVQLFAAAEWTLAKSPSTASTPWIPPLEVDDAFDAASLIEEFRRDPWAMATLPTYLSMLHAAIREPHTKVAVIHDDLETVVKWFAVGTLLLPAEDALDLGCRVFATEPFRTKAQLVGVHPDVNASGLGGAHVIDLIQRSVTEIEIAPEAQRTSNWVADNDALDALEIAALGGRWMTRMDAMAAADGAELVLDLREVSPGREEWDIGISLMEGLGAAGLRDDLELYFDEIADAVASYGIRGTEDAVRAARAARFAADTGVTGLVEAVLVPSLEALAADPVAASAWAGELENSGGWQGLHLSEPDRIAELFAEVIIGAPDEAKPQLVHLAAPLGAYLPADRLQPSLRRAAAYLAAHPARVGDDIAHWYGGDEIVGMLSAEIIRSMSDRRAVSRPRFARELATGAWDAVIAARPHDADARTLSRWRDAARIGLEPEDKRAAAIRAHAARAASDPESISLPTEAWDVAIGAPDGHIELDTLVTWVRVVGLDPALRARCMRMLAGALQQDPKQASVRELKEWRGLAEALAEAEPRVADHQETLAGLGALIDEVPTFTDRVKGGASAIKGLWGTKKSDRTDRADTGEAGQ